jgi:hypothetical protein
MVFGINFNFKRKQKKRSLITEYPEWFKIDGEHVYVLKESPIFWILCNYDYTYFHFKLEDYLYTQLVTLDGYETVSKCIIEKLGNSPNFNTQLMNYWKFREEQFKIINFRDQKQNSLLINELKSIKKTTEQIHREKWKEIFKVVLQEIYIDNMYSIHLNNIELRRQHELELDRYKFRYNELKNYIVGTGAFGIGLSMLAIITRGIF